MKSCLRLLVGLMLVFGVPTYAQSRPSIPKGEITKYVFNHSGIFPGTTRNYWIYVPAQYNPTKPACLLVDQDGIQFKAPAVMDQLIASGEMPVTIGVFVQPGKVPAVSSNSLLLFNRSVEYDGLGDDYARFLIEELLPDVEKKTTRDGRPIRISTEATDRAIMGSSSGAIAAFTAAWERPDQFSRVFSAIGTYVNQRGGNIYPSLIRKYEPKPIRVFLQDGGADHNLVGGNWFLANQEMESALSFAGYEANHTWGTGDHDDKQATQIFPDVMRWLWKDWPTLPKAGLGSEPLQQILIQGESWKAAPDTQQPRKPDEIKSFAGHVYKATSKGMTVDGRLVDHVATNASQAVALSPDQSLLYTDEASLHWVWSQQIKPDGSLTYVQRFYDLFVPDTAPAPFAGGMCVDRDGRLYVAMWGGVEICDQAGRVIAILPILDNDCCFNVWFGGPNRDELYVEGRGERVYARKVKAHGINPQAGPIKPTPPHL
jgi:gluconolactonase